ncbi:hypothetical protein [Roseivivax sediminis]|uniref:hypothetical protein n=1 Tax=Roseivivax sediminis TaxID=936889 RepID=UPI00165FB76F|nr:hypothetical protein [Roseivivax sediminis]
MEDGEHRREAEWNERRENADPPPTSWLDSVNFQHILGLVAVLTAFAFVVLLKN